MTLVNEKFAALNKKQAQTAVRLLQIGFDAGAKVVELNLEALKSLMQEGADNTRRLALVTDVSTLLGWPGNPIVTVADKALGYSRNVYEIVVKAQAEVGETLEQSLLEYSQEILGWVEEGLKASPIGQAEAAAARAAMDSARSVIEGISKAAKQAAGIADANIRAAAAATAEAVKGVGK